MNEKNKKYEKFLENLAELMSETFSENEEGINQYLNSTNRNPDQIEREGNDFLERIRGKIRLELGREYQSKFQELILKLTFEGKKLTETSKDFLAKLIAGTEQKEYSIYFRKLDKVNEEDFKDIKSEIELLNKLDELDELWMFWPKQQQEMS